MPITLTLPLSRGNARNWPGLVVIDPEAPLRGAVWAQEAYEATHKTSLINLLRWHRSAAHRREMELMGHEIETQVAAYLYNENEAAYRRKEARSLAAHYDEFDDYKVRQIVAQMQARRDEAVQWMSDNIEAIRAQATDLP